MMKEKEWEKYVWKKLLADFVKANSPSEVEKLLELFITEHERQQIVKRVAAVSMFDQGRSYREIEERLWLSSSTISAIRKSMQSRKGYITRHARWKVEGRKKKKFSVFSRRGGANTKLILPHGKLVFPQRRK